MTMLPFTFSVVSEAARGGTTAINTELGVGRMTQTAITPTNPGDPWPYNNWHWPVQPTYQPPEPSLFEEYRKLYRKFILEELVQRARNIVEEEYRDKIDKPVREELIDDLCDEVTILIKSEPYLP